MREDMVSLVSRVLNSMEKEYCDLSLIDYTSIGASEELIRGIARQKILERPFAYEFYHQLRKGIDSDEIDLGDVVVQAEVDKRYQIALEQGSCSDFIFHKVNTKKNLLVMELKLASRSWQSIRKDLKKLNDFRCNYDLRYENAILVMIGRQRGLLKVKDLAHRYIQRFKYHTNVIGFDIGKWKVVYSI